MTPGQRAALERKLQKEMDATFLRVEGLGSPLFGRQNSLTSFGTEEPYPSAISVPEVDVSSSSNMDSDSSSPPDRGDGNVYLSVL